MLKLTPSQIILALSPKASLQYQKCVFYDIYWLVIFIPLTTLCFYFKSIILPYPSSYLTLEYITVLCLYCLKVTKIYFGSAGNSSETSSWVMFSLLFAIVSLICSLYFMYWQIYVLELEYILFMVNLGFEIICVCFGIVSFIAASKAEKNP